jgi:hypothetical protein
METLNRSRMLNIFSKSLLNNLDYGKVNKNRNLLQDGS